MSDQPSYVLATDLSDVIGTASAPVVVDVRSNADLHAIDRLIPGAIHRPSEDVHSWWRELPSGRLVVVCDLSGGERAWQITKALNRCGTDSSYLMDGFAGWFDRGLPTRKVIANASDKWVTREHPKIDRIACPWLVSRFINPRAEFIYVPADEVLAAAEERNATPYDIKGVQFGHVGDHCSFDAIIHHFEIKDPALDHLALIVRGADTSRPDLTPQCEGLLAISYGLSANHPDDHEMLKHGLVIYDALYRWCRLEAERQGSARRRTA
jgi:rhodanese-related sulfurtransferase